MNMVGAKIGTEMPDVGAGVIIVFAGDEFESYGDRCQICLVS